MAQDKQGSGPDPIDKLRNRVAGMDDRLGHVDDRLGHVDDRLGHVDDRLGNVQDQIRLLGPALAGLAGLDNVSRGVAELVEVLAPIYRLGNPPQAPEDNVVDAIERVLAAIGPELTIDPIPLGEAPVGYIGQPL